MAQFYSLLCRDQLDVVGAGAVKLNTRVLTGPAMPWPNGGPAVGISAPWLALLL